MEALVDALFELTGLDLDLAEQRTDTLDRSLRARAIGLGLAGLSRRGGAIEPGPTAPADR